MTFYTLKHFLYRFVELYHEFALRGLNPLLRCRPGFDTMLASPPSIQGQGPLSPQ